MSVKNYKNKIDRLCAEYNKIKFRGIYIVLFMLYTALWAAGVIIVILREEELRESMMLPLIIIGSLIQVVAFICIVNYYWRLKNKRYDFINKEFVGRMGKMIAAETAYLIEPLKDKPREIATDTGFIGRFDSVDAHFSFGFHIDDVRGQYICLKAWRQNGKYSQQLLNGDLFVLIHQNRHRLQIRNKWGHWIPGYKYQSDLSEDDCRVYLPKNIAADERSNSYAAEKSLFRKFKQLYPESNRSGIAFHHDKTAFFVNCKPVFKKERKMDYEKFVEIFNNCLAVLRRIETMIGMIKQTEDK